MGTFADLPPKPSYPKPGLTYAARHNVMHSQVIRDGAFPLVLTGQDELEAVVAGGGSSKEGYGEVV